MHENIATAELLCGFVDNLLRTTRVGRVALHEHPVRPSVSELGHGFLGFVLAGEVMDRDLLNALACQLHGNPTAESPRAASDECCVEQYPHSVDLHR